MDEDDNIADLISAFVGSVLHNVEKVHAIRFLTEDHDVGGDETETDHLIEVTFTNAVGCTVAVDGILERFTMVDWRLICDNLLERMIKRMGDDPADWSWETPRPFVTLVPGWNNDDLIDTVTIVWRIPEMLWKRLRDFASKNEAEEAEEAEEWDITERCPHCDCEFMMKWDFKRSRVHCPNCGAVIHVHKNK
jgi:hypothetical protein